MGTITSANAILTINVPAVFAAPQNLQGFAADDIYDFDGMDAAETLMGVDGVLSAGFVYVPVVQNITLQADSASNFVFREWWNYEQSTQEKTPASGSVILHSIGRQYNMGTGWLMNIKVVPDGKRVLQPQRYTVRWQRIVPQPVM